MKNWFIGIVFVSLASCVTSGLDESIDEVFVATPRDLQVPDSSHYDNIQARVVVSLGPTSAYSLERISISRTDTLFNLAVFSRHRERTGDVIIESEVLLDSTLILILSPPKFGKHYFKLHDSQNTFLLDSSIVY